MSQSATRIGLLIGVPLAIILGQQAVSWAALNLKTWSSGETLTAADLNATIDTLRFAVERELHLSDAGGTERVSILGDTGHQQWNLLDSGMSSVGSVRVSTPMSRPGIIFGNDLGSERSDIRHVEGGGIAFAAHADATQPFERMRITAAGRVGIGTTNPSTLLEVGGQVGVSGPASGVVVRSRDGVSNAFQLYNFTGDLRVHNGSFDVLYLNSAGDLTVKSVTENSDARLKKNIRTLTATLDGVARLRGVRFDWNDTSRSSIGVIAQEVQKVYPELVATGPDGIQSVDYGKLTAVLIEASKELHARDQEQSKALERLDRENRRLADELRDIKRTLKIQAPRASR